MPPPAPAASQRCATSTAWALTAARIAARESSVLPGLVATMQPSVLRALTSGSTARASTSAGSRDAGGGTVRGPVPATSSRALPSPEIV